MYRFIENEFKKENDGFSLVMHDVQNIQVSNNDLNL